MTEDIIFTQEGQLGVITLNRVSSLNALTLAMILALQHQLELWQEDPAIQAVVIKAVPGIAFCAGGDVRSLYDNRTNSSQQMLFFKHEYRLNQMIYHYKKPYTPSLGFITAFLSHGLCFG